MATRYHVLFHGLLNESDDDDDDDDIEFGEIEAKAYSLEGELTSLQPNRYPKLETDHVGNDGNIELLFNCSISWMDRTADMEDYLDEVQETIENGLDMLVSEREYLGMTDD